MQSNHKEKMHNESHSLPMHSQAKKVYENAKATEKLAKSLGAARPRMTASKSLD